NNHSYLCGQHPIFPFPTALTVLPAGQAPDNPSLSDCPPAEDIPRRVHLPDRAVPVPGVFSDSAGSQAPERTLQRPLSKAADTRSLPTGCRISRTRPHSLFRSKAPTAIDTGSHT